MKTSKIDSILEQETLHWIGMGNLVTADGYKVLGYIYEDGSLPLELERFKLTDQKL